MVECQFVALNVVGSNPITHPNIYKKNKKKQSVFRKYKIYTLNYTHEYPKKKR